MRSNSVFRERRNFSQPTSYSSQTTPVPQVVRLVQDERGTSMFIGDAANLSFLQTIRRLASRWSWASVFSDDPERHLMVEETPVEQPNWIVEIVKQPPRGPSPTEAQYFLKWYTLSTACVVNLFDENQLYDSLTTWLENTQGGVEQDPMSAIYFLVLAIGAQTAPDDLDELAERLFNYGRFLTMSGPMEDISIVTAQANILITAYLLGASRRNAAFVHLGSAVRTAHVLGLHRSDVNAFFGQAEYAARERVWKVLRVLDLFLSISLGRPPSTSETRNTKADANYSATNDLCAIFEAIVTQVYSKRIVSPGPVEYISQHHRQWTTKLDKGLAADDIKPGEFVNTAHGKKVPNIGLYHVKEAYYWTIMLVARPFLVDSIAKSMSRVNTHQEDRATSSSYPGQVLVHACVDSAIRTVDLLSGLTMTEEIPKRLPFVVNSLFIAGLVLGLAQFGDLDQMFPLEKGLSGVHKILALFSRYDAVAKRNLEIVENLQEVCHAYLGHRARQKMARHSLLIGGLFGTVDINPGAQNMSTGGQTYHAGHQIPQSPEYIATPKTDGDRFNYAEGENQLAAYVPETQSIVTPEDEDLDAMMPGMAFMTDAMPPISPRVVMFDSCDGIHSLLPDVDASLLPFRSNPSDASFDFQYSTKRMETQQF